MLVNRLSLDLVLDLVVSRRGETSLRKKFALDPRSEARAAAPLPDYVYRREILRTAAL